MVKYSALSFTTVLFLATVISPSAAAESAKKNWPTWKTPEEAGFDTERLAAAEQYWQSNNEPLAAFFVVYKGKVLVSYGDVTADHQCHSARKSLLSALYGIHVEQGTIDLEATLEELGIDDIDPLTQEEKQAKVIHLLKARSGVYHEAACETQEMKDARPERGSHAPDTFWYYNNWDFNVLGTIFRQETGKDIFKDFKRKIAKPIGMQEFRVSRCFYPYESHYSEHPCYVFRMSARDRARIGQLFLHNGRWGKKQVIPKSWVYESTRGYSATAGYSGDPGLRYGYMWWVLTKRFFRGQDSDPRFAHLTGYTASGYGGQLIMVLQDAEMVVSTSCDVPNGCFLESNEWGPTLGIVLTARDVVDLRIKNVQAREQIVGAGDTVHLAAKIKNGFDVESWPTEVEFFVTPVGTHIDEMRLIGTASLRALAGKKGKTSRLTTTLPADLPPGSYRLFSYVDRDKTNYDLRRENNFKTAKRLLEIR